MISNLTSSKTRSGLQYIIQRFKQTIFSHFSFVHYNNNFIGEKSTIVWQTGVRARLHAGKFSSDRKIILS